MKNKIKKFVLLIIVVGLIFSNYSYATIGDMFADADNFLENRNPHIPNDR